MLCGQILALAILPNEEPMHLWNGSCRLRSIISFLFCMQQWAFHSLHKYV